MFPSTPRNASGTNGYWPATAAASDSGPVRRRAARPHESRAGHREAHPDDGGRLEGQEQPGADRTDPLPGIRPPDPGAAGEAAEPPQPLPKAAEDGREAAAQDASASARNHHRHRERSARSVVAAEAEEGRFEGRHAGRRDADAQEQQDSGWVLRDRVQLPRSGTSSPHTFHSFVMHSDDIPCITIIVCKNSVGLIPIASLAPQVERGLLRPQGKVLQSSEEGPQDRQEAARAAADCAQVNGQGPVGLSHERHHQR